MRRRKRARFLDFDAFGATDYGDRANELARVAAKTRAADELTRQAEIAKKFRDARDEGDDPRICSSPSMRYHRSISERRVTFVSTIHVSAYVSEFDFETDGQGIT